MIYPLIVLPNLAKIKQDLKNDETNSSYALPRLYQAPKSVHTYFVWHSFNDSLDFLDFYLVSYLKKGNIILTATTLSQLFHQNNCYDFVIHSSDICI